jgi:hypothetical protein
MDPKHEVLSFFAFSEKPKDKTFALEGEKLHFVCFS